MYKQCAISDISKFNSSGLLSCKLKFHIHEKENLPHNVSVEEVYKSLQLDKFPGKSSIELSLAVDRRGESLGHAFLILPRSCTAKLLGLNGSTIKGQAVKISLEKENSHLLKGKKWVKTYREKGMIQCKTIIPQTRSVDPHKRRKQQADSSVQTIDLGLQYDMCADLTHHKFSQDLDEIIAESYEHGIKGIIIPGRCRKQREKAIDLISHYKSNNFRIRLSTGIGPPHADKYEEEAIEIEKECSLNICTCIGPIGLDYRLKGVAKDVQMKTFEEQVKLACKFDKPLYLTEHEAHEDFVRILMQYQDKLPNCAIVDFTGSLDELELYLDMRFYIMITGEIKPQRYLLTTVILEALETKMIPEDQILLASNAPKFPPANLVGVSSYRPCVSEASSNEIPSSNRSEPLCIFTILELTAKYLGHEKMEEIQDFSKQLVKNSKAFLYGPSNVQGRDSKQKVTDKVKKKKSDSFWLLLVYQIFVCVLVFLTERLLKYLDILDLQDHYFCFIVLSIAQLITVLLFL